MKGIRPNLTFSAPFPEKKCTDHFSLMGNPITGTSYLKMIKDWLFPLLQADGDDFILQQDGAPPHWSLEVRKFLNDQLPQQWIGRCSANDTTFCPCPVRRILQSVIFLSGVT